MAISPRKGGGGGADRKTLFVNPFWTFWTKMDTKGKEPS